MRFVARQLPLIGPCSVIASIAYWLHVGVYRHCPPSSRPSVARYSTTSWISSQLISATFAAPRVTIRGRDRRRAPSTLSRLYADARAVDAPLSREGRVPS